MVFTEHNTEPATELPTAAAATELAWCTDGGWAATDDECHSEARSGFGDDFNHSLIRFTTTN